jgi:hypothetical protein
LRAAQKGQTIALAWRRGTSDTVRVVVTKDQQLRLFVSFAPEDRDLKDQLVQHLQVLVRFAGIDLWTADRVRAGDDWRQEIDQALNRANVALLLISADFLASEVLQDIEVPKLFERHRLDGVRVVPVLLRSCHWEAVPWLKNLAMLPKEGKAVCTWSHRDDAWLDVVHGIERVIEERREAWAIANENRKLRESLRDALDRERDLSERFKAIRDELEGLRAHHRQFDIELTAASATLRGETRAAQAQVVEITTKLGEALRELQFHRQRADQLATQQQEQKVQIAQLNSELREARTRIAQLEWTSETRIELRAIECKSAGTNKFVADWAFEVTNTGRHAIRLLRSEVAWCIPAAPESTSETFVDMSDAGEQFTFAEGPTLLPGQRSDAYSLSVDTRTLDAEHAKQLVPVVRPKLRVVYEGIGVPYRASWETVLEHAQGKQT